MRQNRAVDTHRITGWLLSMLRIEVASQTVAGNTVVANSTCRHLEFDVTSCMHRVSSNTNIPTEYSLTNLGELYSPFSTIYVASRPLML